MASQDQSRNASENKFTSWLETTGLLEYSDMFAENGYDDLQLLEGMEEIEVKDMIEVLGIKKQGHVLKLKKCIGQLALQKQTKSNPSTKSLEAGAATPLKRQSSKYNSLDSRIPSLFMFRSY